VRRIATGCALAALAALAMCPMALGDADPASDVLLAENVFYPYSPPVSSTLQAALNAAVAAAHRAHFPIKVALIATATDLGAIPQLYGHPRQYARFLEQEITFAVRAPLLVVMPDGDGTAGLSAAAAAAAGSLPNPSDRRSNALAQTAIAGVRKLAAAAGHPLGSVRLGAASRAAGGGGGAALPLTILIVVCAALAAGILVVRRRRERVAARRQ
jgi:hypothetical protein